MNDSTISAVFSPPFQTKIREIDILLARSCSHCRREGDLLSCVMQISKRKREREEERKERKTFHWTSPFVLLGLLGRGSTCDTSCFFSRESRSRNLHALIRQVLSLSLSSLARSSMVFTSLVETPKHVAPWKFFFFFFFFFFFLVAVQSRRDFSFLSFFLSCFQAV